MAPAGFAADGHKKLMNKGVWTAEEDRMLSEYIEVHGAKKWKTVAAKSGLNRCGKSCRLRWLNYLRPNIKRGNISQEEEDLILRLHKLLGNRWSLIAGRLPGRTDNEIKNYWNSHLCKKMNEKHKTQRSSDKSEERSITVPKSQETVQTSSETDVETSGDLHMAFADAIDDVFDISIEGPWELGWIDRFLELGDESWPKDI